jgi:hypothetical protein
MRQNLITQLKARSVSSPHKWRGWRLLTILSIFLMTFGNVAAQHGWTNTGTSTGFGSDSQLPIASEKTFTVVFVDNGSAHSALSIEVTFPEGISPIENAAAFGAKHVSSSLGTLSAAIPTAPARTWVYTFSGAYSQSDVVHFEIPVSIECDAAGSDPIAVSAFSGSVKIGDAPVADLDYEFVENRMRVTIAPAYSGISFSDLDVTEYVEFSVESEGGLPVANVVLTYSEVLSFSNLEVEGVAAVVSTTGTSTKTTTITINDLAPGVPKKITFDLHDSSCNSSQISITAMSESCSTVSSVASFIAVSYSGPAIAPSLVYRSSDILVGSPTDGAEASKPWDDFSLNGTDVNYYRIQYRNDGGAASSVRKNLEVVRDRQAYLYLNESQPIYYLIKDENGVPIGTPTQYTGAIYDADYGVTPQTLAGVQANQDGAYGYPIKKLKSGFGDKRPVFAIEVEGINLKPRETIVLYYPLSGGDIYDNNDIDNTVLRTTTLSSLYRFYSTISAKNACGQEMVNQRSTIYSGELAFPHITTFIQETTVGISSVEIETARFGLSSSSNRVVDVVVDLPEWLEIVDLEHINAVGVPTGVVSGYNHISGNRYSISYANGGNNFVQIKYKVKSGLTYTDNQSGKISFWVDWHAGGTILEKFTRVSQDITLLVADEGINLTEIKLRRTTLGFKDPDNNNIIGGGFTDANRLTVNDPDYEKLNHESYLQQDRGEIKIKADVLGNYKYLYIQLKSSDNMTLTNQLSILSGSEITGGSTNVGEQSLFFDGDNNCYLVYNIEGKVSYGDEIFISIPFQVNGPRNTVESISAYSYASDNYYSSAGDIMAATDLLGESTKGCSIGTYAYSIGSYTDPLGPISSSTISNFQFAQPQALMNITFPGNYYYDYEIRPLVRPTSCVIVLPVGYFISSDLNVSGLGTVPLSSVSYGVNGEATYEYDLSSINWDNVNLDIPGGMSYRANLRITRAASSAAMDVRTTVYYTNLETGTTNNRIVQNRTLAYTGTKISLGVPATTITSYGGLTAIENITITNTNTIDMQGTWLYVQGNIEGLGFAGDETVVKGSGTVNGENYYWLKVADVIPALDPTVNTLTFKYTGTGTSEVKFYTVSGLDGDTFTADISAPMNPTSDTYINNVSQVRRVEIDEVYSASINGRYLVNMTGTGLEHDVPYNLIGEISTVFSESDVKNPVFTISIPVGQEYVSGGVVTYKGVDYSLDAVLSSLNPATGGNITLNIKDIINGGNDLIIPGNKWYGVQNQDMVVTFTIPLKPNCDTDLTGLRFAGDLTAASVFGSETVSGSGRHVRTTMLLPSTDGAALSFSTTIKTDDDNYTFGEWLNKKDIKIDLRKNGDGNLIIGGNHGYLSLKMPDFLKVQDGVTSFNYNGGTITLNALDNTSEPGFNIYEIEMPSELEGAGFNSTVYTITIPVEYNKAAVATPIHTITASVTGLIQFGTCVGLKPASYGINEKDIAVITTSKSVYDAAPGETVTLEVTSQFGSSAEYRWYKNSSSSSADATTNPWNYQIANNDALIGTVEDVLVEVEQDGVIYGKIPVKLLIRPSLVFNVAGEVVCPFDPVTKNFGDYLTSTAVSGVTYKFYEDENLTDTPKGVTDAVSFSTTKKYYVQSSATVTPTGSTAGMAASYGFVGEKKDFTLTVLTSLTIAPIKKYHEEGKTLTLEANVTGFTADHYTYVWMKKAVGDPNFTVVGGNTSTYTTGGAAAAAENHDEYLVIVTAFDASNNPIGCGELGVEVIVYPSLTITTTGMSICPSDNIITIDLTDFVAPAVPADGVSYSYYTTYSGGTLSGAISDPTNVVTPSAATVYYVRSSATKDVAGVALADGVVHSADIEGIVIDVLKDLSLIITGERNMVGELIELTVDIAAADYNPANTYSYQWQQWDGINFVDIAGATTETYRVTSSANILHDGYRYRVLVSEEDALFFDLVGCGSLATTLIVTPIPGDTYIVDIIPAEGITIDRHWGEHPVREGYDFKIVMLDVSKEIHGDSTLVVLVNNKPLARYRDRYYIIDNIFEDKEVRFVFRENTVSNQSVTVSDVTVRAENKRIFISLPDNQKVQIYNVMGALIYDNDLQAGDHNVYVFAEGVYIVKVGNTQVKVLIK